MFKNLQIFISCFTATATMSDIGKPSEELKKRSLEDDHVEEVSDAKKAKVDTPGTSEKEVADSKDEGKDSKTITDSTKEDEKAKEDTPKYVFGSSTGFGQMSGFKMFSGKDGFSWGEKKEEKKEEETKKEPEKPVSVFGSSSSSTTTVFGSGSTFGNAFQDSLNKKSIFDESAKDSEDKEEKEEGIEEKEEKVKDTTDVYQKVHLEKQEVKSGEENETTIFQAKAKLYYMELSKANDGWKERGIGIIKINKYNESPSKSYTSRLIMRQEGNYKLILNLPLIESFNIVKGMPSSLHADKFLRIQTVDGKDPIQYALKLQVDNVTGLYDSIQKQIFKPTK